MNGLALPHVPRFEMEVLAFMNILMAHHMLSGSRKAVKKTVLRTVFRPLRCRYFSPLRERKVRDGSSLFYKHTDGPP